MGNSEFEMGEKTVRGDPDDAGRERLVLHVDDRGRITIPEPVRESLGIEPDSEITAVRSGTVLTIETSPSSNLRTATAGREDWTNTTPTDAGESLFGPMDDDDSE